MAKTKVIPHVIQRDFLSVYFNGKQHPVSKGQPLFTKIHKALTDRKWSQVVKLVNLAGQISNKSYGKVTVSGDGVLYKGQKIENVLTAKILELIEHNKPVTHMLRFMDNLFRNPSAYAVNEVYQWLASGRFALTDDGCFLAYKVVDPDYKDKYTHTTDNHVGSRPIMDREAVDPDRRNECSHGFHFCSRGYIGHFHDNGDHLMEVKVNPRDVVAIPMGYNFSKGRTWTYEVMREVDFSEEIKAGSIDTPVMMQPVIEYAKERRALIKQVMSLPTVKRLIREGKMKPKSFTKASHGRLQDWLRKFARLDLAPAKSKLFDNPLRFAREAAGLTKGQVAKAANLTLADVYNAERHSDPSQAIIDTIIRAIATLQGNKHKDAGVSYPRPAIKVVTKVSYSYTPSSREFDGIDPDDPMEDEDPDDYSDEYSDEYDDE